MHMANYVEPFEASCMRTLRTSPCSLADWQHGCAGSVRPHSPGNSWSGSVQWLFLAQVQPASGGVPPGGGSAGHGAGHEHRGGDQEGGPVRRQVTILSVMSGSDE
jgi:hypothetical protein